MALAPKDLSVATKLASKAMPGIATGALTSLGNFGMDKTLGKGQTEDFLIQLSKMDKLIQYKSMLTK